MKTLWAYFLQDFVPLVSQLLNEAAERYPGRKEGREWQEHLDRKPIDDFRHIWETGLLKHRAHIVEALENWPDEPDIESAQRSLESMVGYLTILHARLTYREVSHE